MKRYFDFFFLLILLLMICSSCEGNFEDIGPTYFVTKEDHSKGYIYPAGYYYEYEVSTHDDKVQPLKMFNLLEEENIIVKEGWYRQYLAGCSPPGSSWMTTAIYPNVLIVRLKEPNDDILGYKFIELESPQPISCGYEVRHYRLGR